MTYKALPTKITLENHSYRFAHYPNPGAEPAILLIGNLQEIESVDQFSKAAQKELDVYCVELPGCGLNPPLHASYRIQDHSYLLKTLIDWLGISALHLMVFSYSTPIALEFCRAYGNQVRSLALGGSMSSITPEQRRHTLSLVGDVLADRSKFAESFIDTLTSSQCAGRKSEIIRRAAKRKCQRYTEDQIWCFIENTLRICSYSFEKPEQINIPHSVCFTGGLDPYVTPERCFELARKIGADFALIDACDHLFHLREPEQTIQLMLSAYHSYSRSITTKKIA
ncbi:alpha/beta fold hydrolase [Saccharospirillum salsuginis]|uniref:alpha/beta fold hydrolase n=1 Tax=Saccharospirillum salsuginis TaxID=418750 RepID=UPI00167B4E83|nr:alpha/beta hydrolase [Saccharospirillum salsuginis]